MTFSFEPATRETAKARIALQGPGGSGKTKSALRIAEGLAPGGLIGLVKDEDRIELNVSTKKMTLKVSEEEIKRRRSEWKQPKLNATKGVLFKYAQCVKDASQGCVTDEA